MRRLFDIGVALTLTATVLSLAGCSRSKDTADVAQDSMLVKDADIVEHKTDTTSPATLVRDRGSAANAPALTTGAPVKRAPSERTGIIRAGPQPPARVYPSQVLPSRESTAVPPPPARIDPLMPPETTRKPVPVTQPVSPKPPVILQPSPTPRTDSSGPAGA